MRILMFSDVYFPRINGVSTSIQIFRKELRSLGHEIDLITPAFPIPWKDDSGITRIRSRYLFFDPEDRMMVAKDIRRNLPLLKQRGYDLIHIQTPFVAHYAGLRLGRELGLPVVASYHTYFEEYLFHYLPWLPRGGLRACARLFSRSQCNALDAVIVPSTPMRRILCEYGVKRPIHVIPTGLDLAGLQGGNGARFRKRHGILEGRPVLVNAGRVAHEKNIDFLLHVLRRVCATIPETLLVIAGDGPARSHLTALAMKLGLRENLLFTGYLDRETDLLDCYRAGQAFVFSSRTETQGLVLIEALATGTPVVSTSHMGTADALTQAQGALVAKEEVGDFSEKVMLVLKDQRLREELSIKARADAAAWSAHSLALRLDELYRSLIVRGTMPSTLAA